ncbi:MAG: transcriptional regulator [Chloroflexota bacterium]|nr:transcriptional regulator [Chloroflexota bacterium]
MTLSEKIKQLRQLEGELRGLGRSMTKAEVLRAMRAELGEGVSHAYMCQLESGARTHMSPGTRALLARFFKVLPGYLVSDPEGYQEGVVSELRSETDQLKVWLAAKASELQGDPLLYHVLLKMSRDPEPRRFFEMLDELLDTAAGGDGSSLPRRWA